MKYNIKKINGDKYFNPEGAAGSLHHPLHCDPGVQSPLLPLLLPPRSHPSWRSFSGAYRYNAPLLSALIVHLTTWISGLSLIIDRSRASRRIILAYQSVMGFAEVSDRWAWALQRRGDEGTPVPRAVRSTSGCPLVRSTSIRMD
jgi:hypothetical protein